MYSKFGLNLVRLALHPATLLGTNSVYFNPKSRTFYTTKLSRVKLILVTILMFFLGLFFLWRTLEIFLWKGGNSNEYFHISYIFTFASAICCDFLVMILVYQGDICQGASRLVRYCTDFEGWLFMQIMW